MWSKVRMKLCRYYDSTDVHMSVFKCGVTETFGI